MWLCEAAISDVETMRVAKIMIVLMLNFLIICVIANALVIIPEKKISGNIPASPALMLKWLIKMRMVDGNSNCINPEIIIIG